MPRAKTKGPRTPALEVLPVPDDMDPRAAALAAESRSGASDPRRELIHLAALELQVRQLLAHYGGARNRYEFARPFLHGLQRERELLDLSLAGDLGARALRQSGEVLTAEGLVRSPFVDGQTRARGAGGEGPPPRGRRGGGAPGASATADDAAPETAAEG